MPAIYNFPLFVFHDQGVPCVTPPRSEIYQEKAFAATHRRPLQSLIIAHILSQASLMCLVHPTLTSEGAG